MDRHEKVINTEYRDTKNWKLINDYTICEDKNLSDRPYMQTKVPKAVHLELNEFKAADYLEWSDSFSADVFEVNDDGEVVSSGKEPSHQAEYIWKPQIRAKANCEDRITVFSIEDGALLQFQKFDVFISPIRPGRIGGKNNASVMHGIGFSGMSSRDVPEKGLMEGEPGSLWLDYSPDSAGKLRLTLELYLDKCQFTEIFKKLVANIDKVERAKMSVVIELFEQEMQAELKEPWMSSEYGLLKQKDSDWVSARARIDSIAIIYATAKR